jgi:uncharacterized phage protein gp47/JayE
MITITTPDGNSAHNPATYSTSQHNTRIYGASSSTSLEIRYGGTLFTSSEGDIDIDGDGYFVFPSPITYTEGIDLIVGVNTFVITGNNDPSFTLNVLLEQSLPERPDPPSNVRVERGANFVEIVFAHTDSAVSFYTIYAATTSGGGSIGYAQINYQPLDPSTYGARSEAESLIGEIALDSATEEADPLISEVRLAQMGEGEDLSVSVVGSVEIPEGTSRIRTKATLYSVSLNTNIKFRHDRNADALSSPPTIQVGDFTALSSEEPLYYVVTATKVVSGVEIESPFSSEVSGKPISVGSTNLSLPAVTRNILTQDMIRGIYLAQPGVSVQAGSVIRDVIIDPFVSEMERSRFILDFLYRSSSFAGLIQVDDPLNEGASINVADSQYKTALKRALFLQSDSDVQALIDQSFEKLASNFGVTRKIGTFARGEVDFYTLKVPSTSYSIPSGTIVSGGGVQFATTASVSIPLDQLARYYNPITKRYIVSAPVVARTIGTAGNLASGQILAGAPLGLSVTNSSPTFGGSDTENNKELSSRTLGVLSSVDTGTKAGYERISRATAGVISSFVVGAESPFMERDNGLGGKVDIWIRGSAPRTVTDVFAPSFNSRFGTKFIPVGGVGSYRFRSVDATPENPISEMINRNDLLNKFGLKNATTGAFFDLTGYTIEDYRTIALNTAITQPTYTLTSIILGDWRGNTSEKLYLTRQPVISVSSVKTEDGTSLEGYSLVNAEDPLQLGRSSKASAYVVLDNPTERSKIIQVSDESHVIIGQYPERLNKLGADEITISVTNLNGTITYEGPFQSGTPDYTILNEGGGVVSIKRTTSSNIADGEQILISYEYLENITITYTTNLVVPTAQANLDANKNLGADVVVKETIPVSVDIVATIVLERGVSISSADTILRYNLTNFIEKAILGGKIYLSEIIREMNNTTGVSHVRLPLTRLSVGAGSYILREEINPALGVYTQLSLSNSKVAVWAIDTPIQNLPIDGGGEMGRVFINGVEATLLNTLQRTNSAYWDIGRATIVGAQGLGVGYPNTARKVIVALPHGISPVSQTLKVDYIVESSTEVVSEISLNEFSYFVMGDMSFTYEVV